MSNQRIYGVLRCDSEIVNGMHSFNIVDLSIIRVFQYVLNRFYTSCQIKHLCFAIRTVLDFNGSLCCVYIGFRCYTLVNVFCRVIEHAQHRHNPVAIAIGTANLAARGAHIVDMHPDSARPFTDERAILQCIVDPIDTVLLHGD